ncbi:MAG: hypothetical protein JWN14_801 [Chthonomonadales bacterium]|nr:hypothetical protein [Chthonomonadales bacterium]
MVKGMEDIFAQLFGDQRGMVGAVALNLVTCISCGTPFGIEQVLDHTLRKNGKTFYCPNGHEMVYRVGESEADKLRTQLAQEAKKRERLETDVKRAEGQAKLANRRRAAAKGQLTKLRNQVAEGKCPCCGLLFADLHDHMKQAHPDFETTEPEEVTVPDPEDGDAVKRGPGRPRKQQETSE